MGGGDGPEDVAGGFENALNQEWKAKSRYAILLADAPCHGKQYHGDQYDDHPAGDPKGRKVEDQIQQFAKRGIYFSCVKMTSYTDMMHKILDAHYKAKSGGRGITFADLGHSTSNLNFFVTSSVSHSLTLSSGGSGSGKDLGLMNKLISLSSEGKISIIDSVVDKVSKGELSKKKKQSEEKKSEISKEYVEALSQLKIESINASSTFQIIEELDEEEALEII